MAPTALARLDYLIIPCRRLPVARSFYLEILGLPLVEDHPEWVRFALGETFLTLRPRGKWLCWHDGSIPDRSASIQLAFQVGYDQVDGWHEHFRDAGVEVIEGPRDQGFGHRTLFVRDPEQNIIEIFAELATADPS